VIEPAFRALLIAVVGSTVLSAPGCGAARRAAIALSAIAMGTNPKCRLASLAATNSRPENHFSINRHPPTQAGFDNGNGSCQGKTSFSGDLSMKVAQPEPRCLERRGSLPPPSHHTIFRWNVLMLMIGRMIAPSARMMSPSSYHRQKLKKLRFSMTDINRVSGRTVPSSFAEFKSPSNKDLSILTRWPTMDIQILSEGGLYAIPRMRS
jgi:hypothetical protein